MTSIITIFILMTYNFGIFWNWFVIFTSNTILLIKRAFSIIISIISSKKGLLLIFGLRFMASKQRVLQKVWTFCQ